MTPQTFATTVFQDGSNTGIEVPADVVESRTADEAGVQHARSLDVVDEHAVSGHCSFFEIRRPCA